MVYHIFQIKLAGDILIDLFGEHLNSEFRRRIHTIAPANSYQYNIIAKTYVNSILKFFYDRNDAGMV